MTRKLIYFIVIIFRYILNYYYYYLFLIIYPLIEKLNLKYYYSSFN